jgi:amidase
MNPFASATELLADLRAGKITSADLTDLYIRRIEKHDARLNAVVVRDFDRARQQARAADQGGAGALRGLPITLKESINVAGLGTTCGVPEWKGFVSQQDAPATARLRAAGAVVLGKTNVPPMLADWQSANPVYGRANNPWDLGRTPGGSSGGSAAAIAAGLTALEVGSDIGGSIRVPAAFCGVSSWRCRFSRAPTSVKTSRGAWSFRPRVTRGSRSFASASCRRSRGCRWTITFRRRSNSSRRSSARSAAR